MLDVGVLRSTAAAAVVGAGSRVVARRPRAIQRHNALMTSSATARRDPARATGNPPVGVPKCGPVSPADSSARHGRRRPRDAGVVGRGAAPSVPPAPGSGDRDHRRPPASPCTPGSSRRGGRGACAAASKPLLRRPTSAPGHARRPWRRTAARPEELRWTRSRIRRRVRRRGRAPPARRGLTRRLAGRENQHQLIVNAGCRGPRRRGGGVTAPSAPASGTASRTGEVSGTVRRRRRQRR